MDQQTRRKWSEGSKFHGHIKGLSEVKMKQGRPLAYRQNLSVVEGLLDLCLFPHTGHV